MKTNGAINVDNVQGLIQIHNLSASHIDLGNIEDGILHVFAPNSDVTLSLKSLHESSYINCKSLTVLITDEFFQANILEYKDE